MLIPAQRSSRYPTPVLSYQELMPTVELQVLDWEAGALYWNCLRSTDGDEPKALAKVRQKYFDEFTKKDLHFFLGTTQQFHFVAPNPWVIIGVLPIPEQKQLGLF